MSRVRRDQPDRPAVPAGRAQAGPQQLRAAHRLQLGAWRRPPQRPRRLRHLLRSHHARDRVARARPRRSRAADRGARPATCSSSTRTPASFRRSRPRSANPFTGFVLTGAGASGINIIDNSHAEPERPAVEPRRREGAAARHRAARRRRAQPRHALHHRPDHRRGVQPGRRRSRPRRQPRVEREHALRRAVRERRAARHRLRLPYVVHLRQGAELRQRRPDPVRQRADRSDQPAPRVRPDPERPAAQLHAGGVGTGAGRHPAGADRPAGVGRADGHPAARRARRASRSSSATPAAGSSRPAPS